MNKQKTILALFLSAICSYSCKHPDCNGTGSGEIRFAGFDSASLEKVVITTFQPGTNFSEQKSSDTFFLSTYIGTIVRYDTARDFVDWPFHAYIGLKDAKIFIETTGKVYQLKTLTSTHAKNEIIGGLNSGGASSKECYNVIESYELDGKAYNTNASPSYGNGSTTDIIITR